MRKHRTCSCGGIHNLDCLHVGREKACGCGPNEACSRCSTPRPVAPVLDGLPAVCTCQRPWGISKHQGNCRLLSCIDSTTRPTSPVLEQMGPPPACTCGLAVKWQPHRDDCRLLAWMRAADQGLKEATRRIVEREAEDEGPVFPVPPGGGRGSARDPQPMAGLDTLLPQCDHQWLLLDGKAWCPNCDTVRAPPREP